MAILAAGLGFAIRGGIFADWSREFGFSASELGQIGGAGFTGFCFGIILGGLVADTIGYGRLVLLAFILHIVSALVTFGASPGMPLPQAYSCLMWGMFIFAFANGTLEAVANPLVATLFPENRTHYLNILHASWPAGLIIGGAIGFLVGGPDGWSWKAQLALYLIPTLLYGLMFLGQDFPQSAAAQKGLSLGEMCEDIGLLGGSVICFLIALFLGDHLGLPALVAYGVGAIFVITIGALTRFSIGQPLLFVLLVSHGLIGAVELGTDGWIQNITGNLLTPSLGKALFVLASFVMFSLRFCAYTIERRIGLSPLGILLASSVTACVGLLLISGAEGTFTIMGAVVIYALGKTFLWPTMLAVVSDRFPRTGALAISIMGGIGMMSAGLIGTPGLGYFKDRYAAQALEEYNPALYMQARSHESKSFLWFTPVQPIDGKLLSRAIASPLETRSQAEQFVVKASITGDRKTLQADAVIPASLALVFLLIVVRSRSKSRRADPAHSSTAIPV
jgi:MFS family permease